MNTLFSSDPLFYIIGIAFFCVLCFRAFLYFKLISTRGQKPLPNELFSARLVQSDRSQLSKRVNILTVLLWVITAAFVLNGWLNAKDW